MFRTWSRGAFSWRRYLYLGSFVPTPTIIFRRELLSAGAVARTRPTPTRPTTTSTCGCSGASASTGSREPLVNFRYHPASKSSSDVWTQLDEAQRVRLGWAREPAAARARCASWEGAKRAILPRISSWPDPEPTGAVKAPAAGSARVSSLSLAAKDEPVERALERRGSGRQAQ